MGHDIGGRHIDRHVKRAGKAQCIGAAMAFHHHTVQAQENPAIGRARIQLAAQRFQPAAGEQRAHPGQKRTPERRAQIFDYQFRGAFGGFQRHIAGETVGHHHIDRAFGNVVTFDEAGEFHLQRHAAQDVGRAAHRVIALHIFRTDIEKAQRRPLQPQNRAREGRTHDGKIDQLLRAGADIGADVQHHALPALGRPQGGDGGPFDSFGNAELIHRHRHQRAGIAGGDHDLGFFLRHRFDRTPHAGVAPAAQRDGRLVLHPHPLCAVTDFDLRGKLRPPFQQRLQRRFIAMQQIAHARMAFDRPRQCRYDNAGAGIAAHGINRNGHALVQRRAPIR